MKIHVNGEAAHIPSGVESIVQLLEYYQLDPKMVIVERNRAILEKELYDETMLEEGDSLELVHFVSGG
ncbi:sulfur carrier protein ThiS [Falsibacillus albus]|uniref:Sulfur carrier protein ThiS n=1 Tax=Falsibacillus albus TaxID=2478915 RepID=A0A3L7JQW9_9BACI|nr:sulfur carrier protein ThiS [Falsibacillus albus]RLQ93218.1 sulfur carrier protein ThiS [Falsibacillus albus]